MRNTSALVKAIAFVVVAGLFTVLLYVQLRGTQPAGRNYAALFTDSSNIKVSADVRAAGVTVGRVASIDVEPNNLVKVAFETQDGFPMTYRTRAVIRFKNLTGDRFLELSDGPGDDRPLPAGAVLPVSQTKPALDLDALYNGFAPLFEGLQPAQINELTGSIIQVLQGQGGSVNTLLSQVASLTSTLADKDQVIGDLIDNLNGLLTTVDTYSGELDNLVVQLTQLVSGLNKDRDRLSHSLVGINNLTDSVAGLLDEARPDLKGTVHELGRLSTVLNADQDLLEHDLSNFPGYYAVLGRLGTYSSAFQFYLCGVQLRIPAINGTPAVRTPMVLSGEKRCQF